MGLAESPRRLPALRRSALDRARRHARARVARPSRLPVVRIRRAPARARRDGRRPGRQGRRHDLAGRRGGRARSSTAGLLGGAVVARQGLRHGRGGPRPLRGRRRRRQLALRPGARHRPRPDVTRSAWRFAATSRARTTTSRGSRAISTSATGTATICPGTGGSSRSATARSTSASDCSRRSRAGSTSTRSHLMEAFCETAPGPLGHLARDRDLRPDRRPAAHRRLGDAAGRPDLRRRRRRRPGSSTRSTARASRWRTRPGGSRPTPSTSRSRPATASRCRPTTQRLDEVYGLYFKVARTFVRAIGNPAVMRELTRVGMQSRTADGVGAADHGQPAAARRARARRGRRTGRSPRSSGWRPNRDRPMNTPMNTVVIAHRTCPRDARVDADQHLLARTLLERTRDQHLVVAHSVEIAGVEQVDAIVDRGVDRGDALRLVGGSVHPGHAHASEADRRDLRPRLPKLLGPIHLVPFAVLAWILTGPRASSRPRKESCRGNRSSTA